MNIPPTPTPHHKHVTDMDWMDMNLDMRLQIFRYFRDSYLLLKSPSFKEINDIITQKNNKHFSLDEFNHLLRLLGYEYRNTPNGCVLMEDPEITFERYKYLRRIAKFRSKFRPIYYVEERVLDQTTSFRKMWIEDQDSSYQLMFDETQKDKHTAIYVHTVSESGCRFPLFCTNLTPDDFKRWIIDIVVPLLPAHSVIVMDNNPLHGKNDSVSMTKYDKKKDMVKWLKNNNVPCNINMNKAELYELIQKYPRKGYDVNDLDRLIKSYGHEVLRLPMKSNYLSAANLLWKDIQLHYSGKVKIDVVRQTIVNFIASLSKRKWENYGKTIKRVEDEILAIDFMNDKIIDEVNDDKPEIERIDDIKMENDSEATISCESE